MPYSLLNTIQLNTNAVFIHYWILITQCCCYDELQLSEQKWIKLQTFCSCFITKALQQMRGKKSTFSASTEQWFKQFCLWDMVLLSTSSMKTLTDCGFYLTQGDILTSFQSFFFPPNTSLYFLLFVLLKVIMCQVKLLLNPSLRP